jgi:hypothetical protein
MIGRGYILGIRCTGANIDDLLRCSGKTLISRENIPDEGSVLGIDAGWSVHKKTSAA